MSVNVFRETATKIPENDPRINRIDFSVSEIGARKGHVPEGLGKNDNAIKHVTQTK